MKILLIETKTVYSVLFFRGDNLYIYKSSLARAAVVTVCHLISQKIATVLYWWYFPEIALNEHRKGIGDLP